MSAEDLFGRDIALNDSLCAVVTAAGELVLTTGIETALQEVRLRLYTPLGTLFYDTLYGSDIHLFVHDENTSAARMALEAEAARRISEDPAVEPLSVTCGVVSWDEEKIVLSATFRLIGQTHPEHLVMTFDRSILESVVADVRTD